MSTTLVRLGLPLAVIALAGGSPLAAQTVTRAQQQAAADTIGASLASPDQDLRTGFAESGIMVASDLGKTDASIAFSRGTSRLNSAETRLRFNAWTVKLTAPLDEDSGAADFLTDAGLPGTPSLDLSFSSVSTIYAKSQLTPETVIAILEAASARCKAAAETSGLTEDCTANSETLDKWLSAAERTRLAVPVANHWTKGFGFSAGIGREEYNWRDATTLAKQSDRRMVYHVTAQFGGTRIASDELLGGWYFGIGGEYKRKYKEAKAQILCSPTPATGPQECFQSPFAAPERQNVAAAFAIARRRFTLPGFGVPMGVQMKGSHDFNNDVWGFEGALYGLASKDGKLQGGLKIKLQTRDNDPTTDDKKAALAVFVGSAF